MLLKAENYFTHLCEALYDVYHGVKCCYTRQGVCRRVDEQISATKTDGGHGICIWSDYGLMTVETRTDCVEEGEDADSGTRSHGNLWSCMLSGYITPLMEGSSSAPFRELGTELGGSLTQATM